MEKAIAVVVQIIIVRAFSKRKRPPTEAASLRRPLLL